MSFTLTAEMAAQERELPPTDRMLAASPMELFRVGRLEGPPWEALGERLRLAFDARGPSCLYRMADADHSLALPEGDGWRSLFETLAAWFPTASPPSDDAVRCFLHGNR